MHRPEFYGCILLNMETITMYHDIRVIYVKKNTSSLSLPQAYQELIKNVPFACDRMYYGILVPENEQTGVLWMNYIEDGDDYNVS